MIWLFHCRIKGTVLSWIDIAAGIAAKKHGVYPAVRTCAHAASCVAIIEQHSMHDFFFACLSTPLKIWYSLLFP